MQPNTQLDELLLEWEARQRRGESCTPEELCRDRPELLELFRQRLGELHLVLSAASQTGTFTSDGDKTGSYHPGAPRWEPAAPARDSLAPPGYEILGTLGRGGMGVVYKANQVKAKRVVALKMILTGGHASEKEQERFRLEAQSVARLQHPNIVQVFDVGEHQGNPYFALEYCEGGTLATRLNGTPLPPREAAELMERLARAITEAHSKGVVHRDLKPANVLLAANGEPKVTDFGLAKQLSSPSPPASGGEGRGEGGSSASDNSQLTMTGAIMGTPSYMAPEQASGDTKHLGPACDIYALGAILYECLTGRPPFKGASLVETLDQVRNQEPVLPSELNPKVPRDLETICLKCLRKEQPKRYSSARALADDLRNYLDGRPIVARPVGSVERAVKWIRRNPLVTGATLAVMLAMAIGGGISFANYLEAEKARKAEVDRVKERDRAIGERDILIDERDKVIVQRDKAIDDEKLATKSAKLRADDLRYRLGIANFLGAREAFEKGNLAVAHERLNAVPSDQRKFEWHMLRSQLRGGITTFYGHLGRVWSVAFSPDGSQIVTSGGDGTAKLWNARTGTLIREFRGHRQAVSSVAFSPDGRWIVTSSWDHSTRLWDARNGKLLIELKHQNRIGNCVRFSADGSQITTGFQDGTVTTWGFTSGMPTSSFRAHALPVASLALSLNGQQMVTASGDKTARVWNVRNGSLVSEFLGHREAVLTVAFSPDGTRVISGGLDGTVMIWNASDARLERVLHGHRHAATAVAFSPDGTRSAAACRDGTVRIWDANNGKPLVDIRSHAGEVVTAAFSPDGTFLVTSGDDGTVKIWNSTSTYARVCPFAKGGVRSVGLSNDDSRLIIGHFERKICVWDMRTLSEVGMPITTNWYLHAAAISPDGRKVVAGGAHVTPAIWDSGSGQHLIDLVGHTNLIQCVAFSKDGTRIVTGSRDGTAKIWNAASGKILLDLSGHNLYVESVDFSPDGSRILTGDWKGIARIWSAKSGVLIREWNTHSGTLHASLFSSDGNRIVTGGSRGVRVWDAQGGAFQFELSGQTGVVHRALFSRDGTRIFTCSSDKTLRVWDAKFGELLLELADEGPLWDLAPVSDGTRFILGGDGGATLWSSQESSITTELVGHSESVVAAEFSPDGANIVSGSADHTAIVWDVRTGSPVFQFKGHSAPLTDVYFSRDNKWIISLSADKVLKVWNPQTGIEKAAPIPKNFRSGGFSYDGQFVARPEGKRIELIRLQPNAEDISTRMRLTRANDRLFEKSYVQNIGDRYAKLFNLDRLLSIPQHRSTRMYASRNFYQGDLRIVARTTFHHPPLAKTPYDRPILQTLALTGDRLAKRLVAQEFVRDAKPQAAVPLLFECMLSRPITHPPKPPVEELLLAQAYLDLKQPDEARRFYRAAADWLDQPREPFRAMNITSHFATNPWAGLGSLYVPTDDPRRNPFDWESWHECDVFRAEVERRLRAK